MEIEGKRRNINPNEIGQLLPLTTKDPYTGVRKNLSLNVIAQGPKIIVKVALFDSRTSVYRSRDSISSIASPDENHFEAKSETSTISSIYTIKMPFIGCSMIRDNGEELIYLTLRSVEMRYTMSNFHTTMGLSIGWFQIDNQSFDWQIPILFYPTDIQKQVETNEVLPFIKIALIQLNGEDYGINCYRYCGFLMQECNFEISEDVVSRILEFVPKSALASKSPLFTKEDCLPPKVNSSMMSKPSYFEVFQLHPIKLNFSYTKTESTEKKKGFAVYNPFSALMEIISVTIGQVSDVSLRYNALLLENTIINR